MAEDYVQPGDLFRLMSDTQQKELCKNIAESLGNTPEWLQKKMVAHFAKADENYGKGVAKALGLK